MVREIKKAYDKKKKATTKPPNTKRYCKACKKIRTFEYNRTIGHSECSECGWRNIISIKGGN